MQLIHETNRVGVRVTGSTLLGLNHCPVRVTVTGVSPIDGFNGFGTTSSDTSDWASFQTVINKEF